MACHVDGHRAHRRQRAPAPGSPPRRAPETRVSFVPASPGDRSAPEYTRLDTCSCQACTGDTEAVARTATCLSPASPMSIVNTPRAFIAGSRNDAADRRDDAGEHRRSALRRPQCDPQVVPDTRKVQDREFDAVRPSCDSGEPGQRTRIGAEQHGRDVEHQFVDQAAASSAVPASGRIRPSSSLTSSPASAAMTAAQVDTAGPAGTRTTRAPRFRAARRCAASSLCRQHQQLPRRRHDPRRCRDPQVRIEHDAQRLPRRFRQANVQPRIIRDHCRRALSLPPRIVHASAARRIARLRR